MKQALILFAVFAGILLGAATLFGYGIAYQIGYGAVAMMAVMIALTFLWLWLRRTTPLALGMAFGWAGAASVMGWWWMFNLLGRPAGMVDHNALFVFVALYLVGAVLHFGTIQSSMGLRPRTFILPVAGSLILSALLVTLV